MKKLIAFLLVSCFLLSCTAASAIKLSGSKRTSLSGTTYSNREFNGPIAMAFLGVFDWQGDSRPKNAFVSHPEVFKNINMLAIAFCGHNSTGINDDFSGAASVYKYYVELARKQNPNIAILICTRYPIVQEISDYNKFAANVASFLNKYDMDGICIDFESVEKNVTSSAVTSTLQALRKALPNKLVTIANDTEKGLTTDNIRYIDYLLPQTYDHGTNGYTGPSADLVNAIGKGRIILLRNIEGSEENANGKSDSLTPKYNKIKSFDFTSGFAGIGVWRIDQDSRATLNGIKGDGGPTFRLFPSFLEMVNKCKPAARKPVLE